MVIDSSAILAHLYAEPEALAIEAALDHAEQRVMSAVSVLECRIGLQRRLGPGAVARFDYLIQAAEFEVAPFDARQTQVAFEAFLRYGKGTGHPARLNMGDCAAYALATSRGLPLLFVGQDFRHTDVTAAL